MTMASSAFGPMLTAVGPHTFSANGAANTGGPLGIPFDPLIPGAGTLSFISGGQQITLTDFYWANQGVNALDLIGQTSVGPDGTLDYVGGITLSVTAVPEPQVSLYVLSAVAGTAVMSWRRRRR